MTQPPEAPKSAIDADRTLTRILDYAREISGTLRPLSLFDRLSLEVKATFGPSAFVVLGVDEQGDQESASGDIDHPILGPLLRTTLRNGTPTDRVVDHGVAIALPLLGRRQLLGALGVAVDHALTTQERQLLDGYATITGLALDGARLVAAAGERRREWEEAIDAVHLAFLIIDRQGRCLRANRALGELTGRSASSVAGRRWNELVGPSWHEGIRRALAHPGAETIELALGSRTIAVTAFAADPGAGHMVLLFEDQTDRRRLQDRLVQSEKLTAIGQLIAGVAHDLNNPLTSVVGFADFLAESADVPPRIREPLRVIQQEAERASKIVKNLLSFARRQETRQSAALRPILEATVALFRNQLSADRIALEAEVGADLPDLDLNPNQIQQVFVNLLQNAAQAVAGTGREGTVRLRARRWLDGVAVEVADDGPGMSPEVATHVFEPFYTTKPEGQGTGLGLSISQGIIKEHGGRITLATAPGMGSTFTVELPGRVRATPPPEEPVAAPMPPPLRVLVVDDEPHILHYIRATLEAWGHQVTTAADGLEGLERAVAEPFDLIISDLRMPRAGGREFFAELERRAPHAARRVAFSTGDTVRGDTLAFLESQGRPCLQKPFSLAELRALLRDAADA
jgi:two-component system NtrC family sensor kinase